MPALVDSVASRLRAEIGANCTRKSPALGEARNGSSARGVVGNKLPLASRLVGPAALGVALALDLAFGELPTRFHPVVWIGRLIARLEKAAPARGDLARMAYGALMALAVPAAAAAPTALIWRLSQSLPIGLRVIVTACLLKPSFAIRDLFAHVERVRVALDCGDLPGARSALAMIVSRDTSSLDAALVSAAAIESCAENSADSVVAPLFYYSLFGPVGAIAYRACNTADAMIGYHGKYEYLGKASARLDDALNLIPARLTGLLIALASPLAGTSPVRSIRIMLRDARRTESPNAGFPMAAMAGALGVQLEKIDHYRLGDPDQIPGPAQIGRAVTVAGGAIAICAALAMLVSAAGLRRGHPR